MWTPPQLEAYQTLHVTSSKSGAPPPAKKTKVVSAWHAVLSLAIYYMIATACILGHDQLLVKAIQAICYSATLKGIPSSDSFFS